MRTIEDVDRDRSVATKIERIQRGGAPRVLDLFAGCGGFSLGFQRAGCEIVGGVELDGHAARSHALNFHGHLAESDPDLFERHATGQDITKLDASAFIRSLGHAVAVEAVDLLVGGPPCPAFTRVGRAKLREIHDHPEAFRHDPRSQLFLPYLRFVRALSPVAVIMENVPDVMNYAGHNLGEEVSDVLDEMGYSAAYTLLNAANYGVPEMRERFFLVGVHRTIGLDPRDLFPAPTRDVVFPPGYKGSRDVAMKTLGKPLEPSSRPSRWVDTPTPSPGSPGPVTTLDAIGDLPAIFGHLLGTISKGRRELGDAGAVEYPADAAERASTYVVRHAWNWPGFESGPRADRLRAHVIRTLSNRDYRLFRAMGEGWQFPEAYRLGNRLFVQQVAALHALGEVLPEESSDGTSLALAVREAALTIREMLSASHPSRSDHWTALRAGWSGLEPLVLRVLGHKAALHAALMELREAASEFPEGLEVRLDLRDRWRDVGELMEGIAGGTAVAIDADALRKELLRYRSVRHVYEKASAAFDLPPSPGTVCDADDSPSVAVLKKQLKDLPPTGPRALYWLVVRFSQLIGDGQMLKMQFVPPYDPTKFPNKWRKMERGEPARTLMAHLGKDSYSHIHYDADQARTLSVREAARLQSFPDGFRFSGAMNPGFRQIGNAVPPLLSYALAGSIVPALRATRVAEGPPVGSDSRPPRQKGPSDVV